MSLPLLTPSRRLIRAVAAEQAELARHRERLADERDQHASELRRLDEALAEIDARLGVLAQLTDSAGSETATGGASPPSLHAPGGADAPGPTRAEHAPGGTDAPGPTRAEPHRQILRGPAIREMAVQVLVAQPHHIEALHYRRWYELLQQAGYAVAGKDPLAVFLTQVTRSPVVRKATEPGVYEVDRQAPLRIRQRLERLQAELRDTALAPKAPVELAEVRARRHELDLAISQQERALEEALRVLRRRDPDTARRSAISSR